MRPLYDCNMYSSSSDPSIHPLVHSWSCHCIAGTDAAALLRQKASDFLPANQFTFVAPLSSCSIYYDFNLGREKREKTAEEVHKNQIMSLYLLVPRIKDYKSSSDYKGGKTAAPPPSDPIDQIVTYLHGRCKSFIKG